HHYIAERGIIVEQPDEELGSIPVPAPPLRFAGTPATIRSPAPRLGEHTRELLAQAGYSSEQINAMLAAGAALADSSNA
ncbi:MAG: CoA transferase, partial [Quisquiliibacterium sp.]